MESGVRSPGAPSGRRPPRPPHGRSVAQRPEASAGGSSPARRRALATRPPTTHSEVSSSIREEGLVATYVCLVHYTEPGKRNTMARSARLQIGEELRQPG